MPREERRGPLPADCHAGISPAGSIAIKSPAGQYLMDLGIDPADFNSYGARRGNDRVMVRGTFANIRLRNALAGGKEGWHTVHLPSGEPMSIYDAAMRYRSEGTPLVVLAGKEYGTGSSRDWAAKGTLLLGVKAVLAERFERIHRSNLVGMGVLPLQYLAGESAATLGLKGHERFTVTLPADLRPRQEVEVTATSDDGTVAVCPSAPPVPNRYPCGGSRSRSAHPAGRYSPRDAAVWAGVNPTSPRDTDPLR